VAESMQPARVNKPQGKKSFQISAKGSLVILECTDDGRCLTIENTATKVEMRLYRELTWVPWDSRGNGNR